MTDDVNPDEKNNVVIVSTTENLRNVTTENVETPNSSRKKLVLFLILFLIIGIIISALIIGLVIGLREDGDLIRVTLQQTKIGISIDDFPQEYRDEALLKVKNIPDSAWIDRINKQILLTMFRLTFRSSFYKGKKQLTIPQANQLKINFLNNAILEQIDGHYVVTRDYTLSTYILGKKDTAKVSDSALADVGGIVWENFTFPIDPTLIFQNTEFACMDEDSFPKYSVDPESTETFFDDSCLASQPDPNVMICNGTMIGCHCTKGADLSCVEALKQKIGRSYLNFQYERIKWNGTLADEIEAMNIYQPNPEANGADLKGMISGLQSNYIIYRYFSCLDSCEKTECLSGKCGWRRLLIFSTTDVNWGTADLFEETLTYGSKMSDFDLSKYHYLYYYDPCHHHPHFSGYASYKYGQLPGSKQGFCSQDTNRIINNRKYNIYGSFDTCFEQGISAGWADNYNSGLPCQWVDITDLPDKVVNDTLELNTNPRNQMCEGVKRKNSNGTSIYEFSGFYTYLPEYPVAGIDINKHACDTSPGALDNNIESVDVTVPVKGNGLLTRKCVSPFFPIGPKRDCEFAVWKNYEDCTPGQLTKLTCSNNGSNHFVLRVCESSIDFQSGTACRYNDNYTLSNQIIMSKKQINIVFTCPTQRDWAPEKGGKYSLYVGNLFNEGEANISDYNIDCKNTFI